MSSGQFAILGGSRSVFLLKKKCLMSPYKMIILFESFIQRVQNISLIIKHVMLLAKLILEVSRMLVPYDLGK